MLSWALLERGVANPGGDVALALCAIHCDVDTARETSPLGAVDAVIVGGLGSRSREVDRYGR